MANVWALLSGVFGLVASGEQIKRGLGLAPKGAKVAGLKAEKLQVKSRIHRVKNIDDRVGYIVKLIRSGKTDPRVKELAAKILTRKNKRGQWVVPEKDWQAEVSAIFYAVRRRIRYTHDAYGVDQFAAAKRSLQWGISDCFPHGTLLLVEGHRTAPIELITPGTKIWGLDRWSTVEAVWYKGVLSVDEIRLNNGSTVKLTPDHHVYVYHCARHENRPKAPPCACPITAREQQRIAVSELRPGMVVATPTRIPFGQEIVDPDRAYIEGLYLSDGWCSKNTSFEISGQDGCPKEAQKREIEAICTRFGIRTRWARKYISVKDKAWTQRVQQMGHRAPQKRALSIDLDEGAAGALLRGIMADSGRNSSRGRTFTTTSRELFLQTRLLHKMFGAACSERYIVDHGGLGTNPIWRLGIRDPGENRAQKLLRVKEINRRVFSLPVWDISTDDHYVYLPEADVTVSNCDDYVVVLGSLLQAVGYPVRLRVVQTKDSDDWDHIYLLVRIPPMGNGGRWHPLDASVDKQAGWEVPRDRIAKIRDYEVPV